MTFQIQPPLSSEAITTEATKLTTQTVLQSVNDSGVMLLTSTELDDEYVIRFVPGSLQTQNKHIDNAFNHLLAIAQKARKQMSESYNGGVWHYDYDWLRISIKIVHKAEAF